MVTSKDARVYMQEEGPLQGQEIQGHKRAQHQATSTILVMTNKLSDQ